MIDREAFKALVVEALREVLSEERAKVAAPATEYMTPEEAEERRLCSASFARRACRQGRVPALRAGRCWRFKRADLEKALAVKPSSGGEVDFDELARQRLARRAGTKG